MSEENWHETEAGAVGGQEEGQRSEPEREARLPRLFSEMEELREGPEGAGHLADLGSAPNTGFRIHFGHEGLLLRLRGLWG